MDPLSSSFIHLPILQHPFLTSLSQAFAGNVYISGLIMILLNVGTSFLMQDMMPIAQRVFSNVWLRRLVFFAIFFTATRDLPASLLLTLAFILLVDVFLNKHSAYYLIPDDDESTESTTSSASTDPRESFNNPATPSRTTRGLGYGAFQQRVAQLNRLSRYNES